MCDLYCVEIFTVVLIISWLGAKYDDSTSQPTTFTELAGLTKNISSYFLKHVDMG